MKPSQRFNARQRRSNSDERVCFVCQEVVPEREGVADIYLNILVHKGACTVEFSPSIDGPWIVDTDAGAALSAVANGAVKSYSFVKPIRGLRVTVDTTGTQAVVTAVG